MNFDKNNKFYISAEEVVQIFSLALKRIIKEDMHLLKSGIHERSLQFRLACYLREYFIFAESGDIYIDVEYNRDGDKDIKKVKPDDENSSEIFPDVILHERGSAKKGYINDIIYCEIKKNSESGNNDAKKIIEQMENRKYQFGINLHTLKQDEIYMDLYTDYKSPPVNYRFDFDIKELVNE
jgi:hypothetical protein